MSLIVQPDDGIGPVISAIENAKSSIDIGIFRLDRGDVARALRSAVARGVPVRTLIAHTNSGGGGRLRKLERDLLKTGASVRRTDDDLRRYHNKIVIVDRTTLYVLGFNYTALDVNKSRSFGVITKKPKLVQEAIKLFEADSLRKPYTAGPRAFVVSPLNARERLAAFLRGARKELRVYDPRLTDPAMIRILQGRVRAGVSVRILGKVGKRGADLVSEKLPGRRLHVRAIVRDGRRAFVGSQGLRKVELDGRREVGIIVKDPKVVARMAKVFEEDWSETDRGKHEVKQAKKDARPRPRPRPRQETERKERHIEPGETQARHVLRRSHRVYRRRSLHPDSGSRRGDDRAQRAPSKSRARRPHRRHRKHAPRDDRPGGRGPGPQAPSQEQEKRPAGHGQRAGAF
jgi:cardiolipin synthase